MNSRALRRLAADHAALHRHPLPPYYLFPPHPAPASDDLTHLTILLAGPAHTPYAHGLFTLTLTIPQNYPTIPPIAHFRTPIFHPNVDPSTGAICVETLKRDWEERLTLRDVLVVVSCLLVVPNEESALNAEAGAALREGWGVFVRRAEVWTKVHAGVPAELRGEVEEARGRGEDKDEVVATRRRHQRRHVTPSSSSRFTAPSAYDDVFANEGTPLPQLRCRRRATSSAYDSPETEQDDEDDNQENDGSRSPMKRKIAPTRTTTTGPVAGGTPRRPPGAKAVPLGELILEYDATEDDDNSEDEAEYPPSPRKNRGPGKKARGRPPTPHIADDDEDVIYSSDHPESSRAAENEQHHHSPSRRRRHQDASTTPPANLFHLPLAADSPFACAAEGIPSPRKRVVVGRTSAAPTCMRPGSVGGLFVGGRRGREGAGIFRLRSTPSPAERKRRQAALSARLWVLCGGDVGRWNRGEFGAGVIWGVKGGRW